LSYLSPNNTQPVNKLEIKLVRSWPPSKDFQQTIKEEHEIYTKYQTKVHKDSPIECNMNQFQRFLCTSPLMPFSHNGPLITLSSDKKKENNLIGNIDSIGYGSFHQQYRLNGKLVAVGVIDILNDCVSSVYFFYDPEFQFLNLGTYSSLREIEFTRQLNRLDPNIKW
jgi:arginine-tRNA-protein transferase